MKLNVVIPCGGRGERSGLDYNKLFYGDGLLCVAQRTAFCFARREVTRIIIARPVREGARWSELFDGADLPIVFVDGGDSRTASVAAAIAATEDDCDFIAVHDGARPFLSTEVIDDAERCAMLRGSAVPTTAVTDSLRYVGDGDNRAVDRAQYRAVQTPQIFKADGLRRAYAAALANGDDFTDDAQIYEKYVGEAATCEGSFANVKITSAGDLARIVPDGTSIGNGWDTHRLQEGRRLILGGVEVPFCKGLVGHSDADVLAHAIMDALLSACGERDIGCLFPDDDATYKDADSMKLLAEVCDIVEQKGLRIFSVSAAIIAQKPRLKDFLPLMRERLAAVLKMPCERIALSATTTEKLGICGREEAISANAVCLLSRVLIKKNQ